MDITFLGQVLLDTLGQIPYASALRKRVLITHISCHKHLDLRVFHKPDRKAGNKETFRDFKMLTRLDDTLDPLIRAFNRDKLKHRLVALLSPT